MPRVHRIEFAVAALFVIKKLHHSHTREVLLQVSVDARNDLR